MGPKPFEHVIDEHGPAVLRVARARVPATDADDVWVETFIAALRAYSALPPTVNIEAWLVTIARNKSIDHLRAAGRQPELNNDVDAAVSDEINLRDEELWAAVESLPRKQRDAVIYHHIGGLPYTEVAQILGNSEVAARRAAADGLKTLRATYREVEI